MELLLDLAAGFFASYLICSLSESFFHDRVYHAGPRARRAFKRFGAWGRVFTRAWFYHHVVHHHLTYRTNHVTQFTSREEQTRLDERLTQKGRGYIIKMAYGARVGPGVDDWLYYVLPALPPLGVLCVLGGPAVTLGALLPLIIWPCLAHFIHPYLHMDYATALKTARWPVRLFLRTRVFRFIAAHHWLHHTYEDCNFNLLLGGDVLLGVQRLPSADDLKQMQAIGMRP